MINFFDYCERPTCFVEDADVYVLQMRRELADVYLEFHLSYFNA